MLEGIKKRKYFDKDYPATIKLVYEKGSNFIKVVPVRNY